MRADANSRDVETFFRREYKLDRNPFTIIPCQNANEYLDRFNGVDKFLQDLNMINISGMGANRIVIGDKGMGKTSFMNMCALKAKEKGLKSLYIDHVPNRASALMKKLFRHAAELAAPTDHLKRLEFLATIGRAGGTLDTTEDFFSDWVGMMRRISPAPVIVFLDETSPLPEMRGVEAYFNNYIYEHIKDVVFVIGCTTVTYNKISTRMGGFIDRFPTIVNLTAFSKEECIECLKKKMGVVRIKKSESPLHPFTREAIESMIEFSKGVPRYLIEIAFTALTGGAMRGERSISQALVEEASFALKKSTLHNTWSSLPLPEKNVLVTIAKLGGQINLEGLATTMKKTKPGVWYPLITLIECGLVEKVGVGRKDISYKLTVDPKTVFELSR